MKGLDLGKLVYGTSIYHLEDRVLAHLQVVVGIKLRRSEKFFVSWRSKVTEGSGRQSVWFDNGLHIAFEYDGARIPSVNRGWVETMTTSAGTNFGLQITDEDGELLNTPRGAEPEVE